MQPDEHEAETSKPSATVPAGITAHTGEAAAREARAMEREARREGANDPLDGLAKRIEVEKRSELAFDVPVIDAAANLRNSDARAFEVLRGSLKAAGVPIGRWVDAVNAAARAAKVAARDAEKSRNAREAATRREALDARREAERVRRAEARAPAATDIDAHVAEGDDGNGTRFMMVPGLTTAETATRRGETKHTVLARASVRVVADVSEFATPDAIPRRKRRLSIMCGGDHAPFVWEMSSVNWSTGAWIDTAIPARGFVPTDRRLRTMLLDAIGACSAPVEVRRYGFTGWIVEGGRALYLHGARAVGAEGDVSDVDVVPDGKAAMIRLSQCPEGEDAFAAALAVVELLSVEPATVIVPMIGLAFRAAMGPTRATVHVSGRPQLGKSMAAGLVASLFGASMVDTAPASWSGDSVPGILGVASSVGDALLFVDDLNLTSGGNVDNRAKFERVVRMKYDGQGRNLRQIDGGTRTDPRPRCAILSTGEVLPKGAACTSRVVTVDLDVRPSPDVTSLMRRAREGELSRAMAAFLRWYAPRYTENLPNLDARDREAARAWGLGEGDRAAGLMGALVHGLEALFAFFGPGGLVSLGVLDAQQLAEHRARAETAMRAVAARHNEHVSSEDPAARFCAFIADALRSGRAHLKGLLPRGRQGTPKNPEAWGWRQEERAGESRWREMGPCIGYLPLDGAEVLLMPGPSFEAATERARAANHLLGVDVDALGQALVASGMIEHTHGGKSTIQQRIGAGQRLRMWALKVSALGYNPASDDAPDVDET